MRNAEKRKKMKLAIEIQKNLEEAALGKSAHDPARGFGKRTAQMGLSIKAALILVEGIHKMLSDNPKMLTAGA